jgi:beta-aspartyl-dipeptidase (metallo-type)
MHPAPGPALICLTDALLFDPEPRGRQTLVLGGGRVLWSGPERPVWPASLPVQTIDLAGRRLIPGLVDCHAHLTGGGGEAGFASRVPAPGLSRYVAAGVTTAVGLLGTDDTLRSIEELSAVAQGLSEEGLSTWFWTGGYHLPLRTLTGSARRDICCLERCLGVGELALSDHRSSQPTLDELLRVAADAHVAGLMTGKAGILHLHLGDGPRGLQPVFAALERSELPARVFHPTHVNRRRALFEEALELARRGAAIDVTAFPVADDEDAYSAAESLRRFLAAGLPIQRLTVSSDGGGCLPRFDAEGRVSGFDVGDPASLLETLGAALQGGLALESVLPAFTSSPARLLRLEAKGHLRPGADADCVALDERGRPWLVVARGRVLLEQGQLRVRGRFEGP